MLTTYYSPGNEIKKYNGSSLLPRGRAEYFLMHRNIRVAKFSMTKGGLGVDVIDVYNPKHMPVGTRNITQPLLNQRFAVWKRNRTIQKNRREVGCLTEKTGLTAGEIETINMGLCITDCYWFCPVFLNLDWKNINFHNNHFSDDVGKLLLNIVPASYVDLKSPDIVVSGHAPKKWLFAGDKLYLIKSNLNTNIQELCNEVFASWVAETLGVPVVKNYFFEDKDYGRCIISDCFITDDNTEFVTMEQLSLEEENFGTAGIMNYIEKNNYKPVCDKMIVVDYLLANRSRGLSNFGFIRDATSLEVRGFAPLFGFDKSMNSDSSNDMTEYNDAAKTFAASHDEQIKLVEDFSWIDFSNICTAFPNHIEDIYRKGGLLQGQVEGMKSFFLYRLQQLKLVVNEGKNNTEKSLADKLDVDENGTMSMFTTTEDDAVPSKDNETEINKEINNIDEVEIDFNN